MEKYAIVLLTLRGKFLMTNLARYFILGIISFLFSLNFPVLAGTNIAGMGNLTRAQEKYYDSYPPIIKTISRAYESGVLFWFCFIGLVLSIILAIIFTFRIETDTLEENEKDNVES